MRDTGTITCDTLPKNLGAGLKGKIRTASFEIKNSSDGNTSIGMSFPMKVINSMGIVPRSVSTRPTRAPESNGRYAPKPGGNSHQRTVYRTAMNDIGLEPGKVSKVPSPPGKITPAGKGAGAGFLIANAIELGMSIWANSDISTAQAQASYYLAPSEELVRIGIAKNIVPNEYHSNPQVLADLANYVFQGELNGNYDSETKSTLLEIGKNLVFHGHVNGYNVNWRIIPIRKNRE